jgi:hypothetical protein
MHSVAPEVQETPPSDEPSTMASSDAASVPGATSGATVASGTSETVESGGPASIDGPPLLLPLAEPVSSLASGTLVMFVELPPPHEATTLPTSTPMRASRIQDLESIM